MIIDWKTIFAGIAIVVSLISLFISIKNYRFSRRQHAEKQDLDFRKILAAEHKPYLELYHKELLKIKAISNDLSSLLNTTNSNIGTLFQKYSVKSLVNYDNLGCTYDQTHELIKQAFQRELSWQTPENIYSRLTFFKNVDFKDYDGLNPDFFNFQSIKKNIVMLEDLIPNENKSKLYNDFLLEIDSLATFFDSNDESIKESIEILENELMKNSFEEFPLKYSYKLYRLYKQLLNLLKFISQSRIQLIFKYERTPYLKTNTIVFIGANIAIINALLNAVVFSYLEE